MRIKARLTQAKLTATEVQVANSSLQLLCNFENLFGSCAHEKILRHHSPANSAGRIDQELCWARNVCAIFSLTGMNEIIAANCLEFWIG